MTDRKILGYAPIYETPKGALTTQAFILCSNCGAAISTVGGPRQGAICMECWQPTLIVHRQGDAA